MKQQIIMNLALAFALLFSVSAAKAQRVEEPIFSAGASVQKGILEKIITNDNVPKEVCGFTKNEDGHPYGFSIALQNPYGEYYLTSNPVSDYFLFANEGDILEIEGIYISHASTQQPFMSVIPTRISGYNREIHGELSLCPNPVSTIPTLPGMVFSIKESESGLDFILVNNCGVFNFSNGESIELLGNTYTLGATIGVRGAVSQRWDLNGQAYADIWVRESAPVSVESVEVKDFLTFERNSEQITIHSTQGIKKLFVYSMGGNLIYRKDYDSMVNSTSFHLSFKENILISIETGNKKHISQVIRI